MLMRQALNRRYWNRIRERRRRLGVGVQHAQHLSGHPDFIDYHPDMPATLPEKMIFAYLESLRVNFAFSYQFGDIPITATEERARPDFWLYDLGIIIELSGWYWHTREGMFEHDMNKHVLLTAAGWKVYNIIDREVLEKGARATLNEQIPELAAVGRKDTPSNIIIGEERFDPTIAIRSRLQKFPKRFGVRYRDMVYGKQGVRSSWSLTHRAPRVPSAAIAQPFTHELIDKGLSELYGRYGGDFTRWIKALTDRFIDIDPENDETSILYWYWVTWMVATQGRQEGYSWDPYPNLPKPQPTRRSRSATTYRR